MTRLKQLFLMGFIGSVLAGCASQPPAPIDRTADRTADVHASARGTGGERHQASRSPELLLQAIAAGGTSAKTGFDCSGLVAHVFKEAYGLLLPHNAKAQSERGKFVPARELEAGDLVFFNTERQPFSHVGIYLGDGRFIHAPKPGAVVRTENMQLAYWRTRYDGARRLIE